MDKLLAAWAWLKLNYIGIFVVVGSSVLFLEVAVRFTPTKKDDGFVKRLGNAIDKLFDICRFPNIHSVEFQKHVKGENAEAPKQP